MNITVKELKTLLDKMPESMPVYIAAGSNMPEAVQFVYKDLGVVIIQSYGKDI